MLECVTNISEGRDAHVLAALCATAGPDLLDVHTDPDHHRSVFTLIGEEAVRHVCELAVSSLDIRDHTGGVHPRLGVVDVVPFVPLAGSTLDDAVVARQAFAEWAAHELGVPCFLYGPSGGTLTTARTLPDIRSAAWTDLAPDLGPDRPHPRAGAICVGARPILVAYNIWVDSPTGIDEVRAMARAMRSPRVRALALTVADSFQVSMNLIDPERVGPQEVYDQLRTLIRPTSLRVRRCELIGLIPRTVLDKIDPENWEVLDLSDDRTIEYRLEQS